MSGQVYSGYYVDGQKARTLVAFALEFHAHGIFPVSPSHFRLKSKPNPKMGLGSFGSALQFVKRGVSCLGVTRWGSIKKSFRHRKPTRNLKPE